MSPQDATIAYCQAIGKDPHENVAGYERPLCGNDRIWAKRWQWFLGASPAVATGATQLSPTQIARREGRE
ncbi:hypothetical protein [Beijerinckia sp. L45]|uniref:hypothetical protein n=1 Tax=Beijerinckia sp. L45 TaxID=1641855 RepID=UPI00131E99CD|nr:hypothetical protein [Beijerinckia sp. L45]